MAEGLNKLLTYIIEHPIMQAESREAQIDASAVQDVDTEISAIKQDQLQDAQRLEPFFEMGLRKASNGKLTVDDTDAEGDKIADAFARFLVTTGLATAETTNLSDGHYRYNFDVNW